MAGTTYSGAYTTGISLTNPATQRPVTVTGTITNAGGQGILGTDAFAWIVNNRGTVESTATTSGIGVQLLAGGTVNNLVAGSVSPSGVKGAALLAGYNDGVLIEFAPGIVSNLGQIEDTGANGIGVSIFEASGRVTNGSASDTTALISGPGNAIVVNGGAGTVTNFGTIASTGTHTTIVFDNGGSIANGTGASTAALISSAGTFSAISISYGAGTVTNFGAIKGGATGVFFDDGGRVTNGQSGSSAGLIQGGTGNAASIAGAVGTVTNFGTVQATGTVATVALTGGGAVINGAVGATTALITGSGTGIYINNAPGTVTNFGHITATSALAGTGITLEDGGTVTNFGTVQNSCTSNADIYFHSGGSITNGKSGASIGLISGANNAVSFRGGAGTVTNGGSLQSSTASGIYLNGGGSVTNQAGGLIAGHNNGVYNRGLAITVVNSGLIETTGTLNGIYLRGGGSITNNAGGTISGSAAGVALGQTGGVVTNHGLIQGVIGFYGGIHHSGNNTLINFGTVASTSTLTGAVAIEMGNSVGSKLLIVEKGAVFTGLVQGGGRGEIQFATTGTAAMGSNISGFNRVALANGSADSLTLANANLSGVDGRLTVIGGNSGNTVNAAAVTTGQLTIDGGAGADALTGGANGGTIFVFAAATLTATDTITGSGGFNNQLEVTTPGTVNASGVTGVEIYRLANGGANSLTLTSANFTGFMGNAITVYGGTGGNTIDGSGLTVAADRLVIYGGSGADVLKGGAGNDVFSFTTANLTATDTISGGAGNDELRMTTAGTVAAGGVVGVETYVLADGGANSLTLASANFAGVAGSTIIVSDGNGGTAVSASGVAAPDRVIVYAGTGADVLTGGPGNDVFYAGGKTTMAGGTGTNQFTFSAAGSNTITDFTASSTNKMEFISGSGFALPGATSTPKALGTLFTSNATGAFTATTQRFAYDTANGNLFYSAGGTTATEHLVVTVGGHPTLTASHLLFAT
jgi:RTX calcium-binding nonapeptide repeat (4 copies)